MTYSVLVARSFQKAFRALPKDTQGRVRKALGGLCDDPFTPRSGADIRALVGTTPKKYRLRVGDYRIVYQVTDKTVHVLDSFVRGKGYADV